MKNPNELSATSSWRGNELQLIEQKANIVVGVANSRTRLRIGVLLSKYSEYQVDYISSESEIGKLIEEADLIIGVTPETGDCSGGLWLWRLGYSGYIPQAL